MRRKVVWSALYAEGIFNLLARFIILVTFFELYRSILFENKWVALLTSAPLFYFLLDARKIARQVTKLSVRQRLISVAGFLSLLVALFPLGHGHDFLVEFYRSIEINSGSKFTAFDGVRIEALPLLLSFFTSLFDSGIAAILAVKIALVSLALVSGVCLITLVTQRLCLWKWLPYTAMFCACMSLNQTHFLNHLHYDSVCAGFVAAFILVRHFIELDGRHSNQSHFDLLTTVVRPEAFLVLAMLHKGMFFLTCLLVAVSFAIYLSVSAMESRRTSNILSSLYTSLRMPAALDICWLLIVSLAMTFPIWRVSQTNESLSGIALFLGATLTFFSAAMICHNIQSNKANRILRGAGLALVIALLSLIKKEIIPFDHPHQSGAYITLFGALPIINPVDYWRIWVLAFCCLAFFSSRNRTILLLAMFLMALFAIMHTPIASAITSFFVPFWLLHRLQLFCSIFLGLWIIARIDFHEVSHGFKIPRQWSFASTKSSFAVLAMIIVFLTSPSLFVLSNTQLMAGLKPVEHHNKIQCDHKLLEKMDEATMITNTPVHHLPICLHVNNGRPPLIRRNNNQAEAFLLSKTCDNTGVGYLIDRRESQGAFQRLLSSDQFQNVAKSCNYSMIAAGDYTMVATTQTRNH